jgi:hypothetical protein
MNSLDYAGRRHSRGIAPGSRKAVGNIQADPWIRPGMSTKCSDSHDMKEYGFRLCFLATGQRGKVLPGLYFLRRQPAPWQALGTPSRHYASKQ